MRRHPAVAILDGSRRQCGGTAGKESHATAGARLLLPAPFAGNQDGDADAGAPLRGLDWERYEGPVFGDSALVEAEVWVYMIASPHANSFLGSARTNLAR
jgi:hypothetical protein